MWLAAGASTNTGGPSVDVHGWVAWVIIGGALAAAGTAIYTFWRRVLLPLLERIERLSEISTYTVDGQTLISQFQAFGSILRAHTEADVAVQERFRDDLAALTASTNEFVAYVHTRNHDIMNMITKVSLAPELVARMVELIDKGTVQAPVPRRSPRARTRSTDRS